LDACYAALKAEAAQAHDSAAEATERASAAESAASSAQRAETRLEGELEAKAQAVAKLSESNVVLRTEAANAKQAADAARLQSEAAERTAAAAQEKLEEQDRRFQEELKEKMKGAVELETTCTDLRASLTKAQEEADYGSAMAAVSEKAASDAKEMASAAKACEVKARAELQVKVDEATRLSAACCALQMEIADARRELSSTTERATASENTISELRSQLKVALGVSELRGDEVRKLARAPPKPKSDDKPLQDPLRTPKAKGQQAIELTLADVELALGMEAPETPPANERPADSNITVASAAFDADARKPHEMPAAKRLRCKTKSPGGLHPTGAVVEPHLD